MRESFIKITSIIQITMIINRPEEVHRLVQLKKWSLMYGRRKTGKTFLITNFFKYDDYFFVKNNRSILNQEKNITYETFLEIVRRELKENKILVIDEFHRLGEDFFDFLHASPKQGRIILVSSTLYLSKKLLSSQSALLGIFAEIPLGLINLKDTLSSLKEFRLPPKDALEMGVLLREPLAIDYFSENKTSREIIVAVIFHSLLTVPALIGEIFVEEERRISAVYEGILRAIAGGKITSGEISTFLFSRRLLKKDDPSFIQQYLQNLTRFGLIKRIEIYNKKRFVYKHVSPLTRMFYYFDEKYNLTERKVSEEELYSLIQEIMPRIVEDQVREFLAEKYGLRESIIETADFEVDGCLLRFNKPEIILEVKWRNQLSPEEISQVEQNLSRFSAKEKILFVPDKKKVTSVLKVFDVNDLFLRNEK